MAARWLLGDGLFGPVLARNSDGSNSEGNFGDKSSVKASLLRAAPRNSLDCRGGVSTAAVQVHLSVKKMDDKMCEASIPVLKKNVKDSSCDPINIESIKANCQGFHGISFVTSDESAISVCDKIL
ncbi:hypothetical protein KQX54_014471 [Cotesia glomerata]|uniref:Uncharacterized protein n=1 Tax=Cotesia glomerata TaxID=32391 RepID=A0AAV7II66_COTGL|nr:hypothetical protein KQX54_014471 [Cotesia glomerata]